MKKSELTAAALVLAVGIALLVGAFAFPFLQAGVPGPGFLPLLIAVSILAAGLALVAGTVRRTTLAGNPHWPAMSGWWRVIAMMIALTVAFLLLEALGFLIVTTIFMAAMIYCLGERSWRVLAMVPPLSAIALYAVFAVWLRVPLPKGILTFIG